MRHLLTGPGMVIGMGFLGCATSSVLFQDHFDTPGTLQRNWILQDTPVEAAEEPSRWEVFEGKLYQRSNIYRDGEEEYAYYEGTRILTRIGQDWTDIVLEVTLHPSDDNEHFYRFFVVQDARNKGPRRMLLQAKVGDPYETLAEIQRGYTPDSTYRVRITVQGPDLRVVWNGEEVFTVQDNRYPRGRIGFQCYAEQGIWFDDVVVK